jgi:hypothetical protein
MVVEPGCEVEQIHKVDGCGWPEGILARNGATLFQVLEESEDGRREIRIRRIVLGSRFLLRKSITEVTIHLLTDSTMSRAAIFPIMNGYWGKIGVCWTSGLRNMYG